MIIKKFEKNAEDGSVLIEWLLNIDQQALLLNYAIEALLARGLVHAVELSPEDYKKYNDELQEKILAKYMEELNPEEMPQA